MNNNQFLLLKTRRFLPLFITQFLGAFHDNFFKNAVVVLLTYETLFRTSQNNEILTTMAAGIFILPFVLFSAIGGELSDKYAKNRVIRMIKLAEIGIAILGFSALVTHSLPLCFVTLFALGTHSAFFGPSKYSILPQHLEKDELIGGNALLNTGTFLAILLGTMASVSLVMIGHKDSAMFLHMTGEMIVGLCLIACAVTGYLSSRFIPDAPAVSSDSSINWNIIVETGRVMKYAMTRDRAIVLCILGVSWFYFMGGMFMAQFSNYTNTILHADQYVLTFFLVLFSVGIAIGGLLNNRLLKGRVEAVYVPLAALGISLFSIDLYFASGHASHLASDVKLRTLVEFLSDIASWRIALDIALIAVCGGLFVVPLNAIIQDSTAPEHRARVQAGNAIMNAVFIAASAGVAAILFSAGWNVRDLFLAFALANAGVAVYICKLLPDYLFKTFLKGLFKILYNVEIRGYENFEKAGKRAVIVSNHVSLLDPPLLAAFLPGTPMFAVNTHVANWWFVKPFLRLVDAFPLDPTNPFSMKSLIRKVEEDRHVVIFPEGRLTETGALMKVYDGPGMIADKTGAMILPVRIDGVQHTPFARLKGKVPLHNFPKITITILEPRKFSVDEEIKGRARRAAAGRQLYDLMEEMMFLTGDRHQTLYQALLKARFVNGDNALILEDIERQPLKFKKLVQGSIVLARKFIPYTQKGENVGVMLPNSVGTVLTFFGLQAIDRIPAMLNFSSGAASMVSACKTAKVKTVLTSRRFVEVGRLQDVIQALESVSTVIYLEDLKKKIGFADKLHVLMTDAKRFHARQKINPNDPAVVLFTSGSEGEPKGVVLSHANIMSNIIQLSSRVDFNRQDIVFNCLPMFHSFGLTGGALLPVLCGIRTFLYPSPLHYRIVPEVIYSTNATIMFGTDTFLNGYGRMANPYDFFRMRYIFAGAEKVKEETRKLYMERFGVQILEGYGATETSPAIAVNSAMHQKHGTVGRFLSGTTYKLEPVPGVENGARLHIKGPHVMLGYYKSEAPGVLQPPLDGWHDTGDIVSVDSEGFVKILGRAKRFAKIAGEMVSLTQAESLPEKLWPTAQHAIIAKPDPKKGEQLALVTTQPDASRQAISEYAAANGISNLLIPSIIMHVQKMPVLGSGKTDYAGVKVLIEQEGNS